MIDNCGKWIEEKDYSKYPIEKWCDYDYMAEYLHRIKYKTVTTMGHVIDMILDYIDELDNYDDFYNLGKNEFMINPEMVIEEIGGIEAIKEYDYDV